MSSEEQSKKTEAPHIDIDSIPSDENIIEKFQELCKQEFNGVDDSNFEIKRNKFYQATKNEFSLSQYQLLTIDIFVIPIPKQTTCSTMASFNKYIEYKTQKLKIYVCINILRYINFSKK